MFLLVIAALFHANSTVAKKRKSCCGQEKSSAQLPKQGRDSVRYGVKGVPKIEKTPFKEKAQDWLKKTWGNTKNFFNSARKKIEKNLERPENETRRRWRSAEGFSRESFRKQKQAQRLERKISAHLKDSERLVEEVAGSNNIKLKKYSQRYHRQAKRSQQSAESAREELEFALRNISKESQQIYLMNEKNLEEIKLRKEALIEYQREVKKRRHR